jgi:hypothetical protein
MGLGSSIEPLHPGNNKAAQLTATAVATRWTPEGRSSNGIAPSNAVSRLELSEKRREAKNDVYLPRQASRARAQ